MNNRKLTWALTLMIALGMGLAGAQAASASPSADQLPQVKNPSAAKFNLTGMTTLKSGSQSLDISIPITGNGAVSGNDYQIDVIAKSPEGAGSTSFESTSSQRGVGGKLYSKLSTSPGDEGQWYVSDATGVLANNSYGGVGSVIGIDDSLQEFTTTEQVGKEVVEGVAATKYKLDIDYKGFASSIGIDVSALGDVQYVINIWIGDKDLYIHKVNYALNIKTGSSESQSEIGITYDLTFYDFDVPVTIVAPPDAVPLDMGSTPGMTGGMPTTMGMPGMTSAGMPTTGSGNNTLPLALLALGMGLVLSGGVARRVARARQKV